MKRILIFSLAYYPKHVGGAEVAIKEITDRLDPDEFEFHLICNRYASELPKFEKIGNVFVHRIGFAVAGADTTKTSQPLFYLVKVFYVPLAAWKAWRLHQQYPFDAFWSMMLYMSYPVALLQLFGLKRPYALTLQEGDTFDHVFNRWYIKLFEPILLRGILRATVVQSISNFLSDWAQQKGYVGASVVIPNAVNTKHFSQTYDETEMRVVREALHKGAGDTFLVTTSRLVHKNAVDDVIRALVRLPENVHFIIFGTGPEEAALRKLAGELRVDQRVQFRGQLEHTEMPKYLRACDIFIRPSRSEGMGISFVEAMAAKLPVIATQEGGIADFLFDAKRNPDKPTTGWAVGKDNSDEIAQAVNEIMARSGTIAEVTQTAYEMVVREYDWDKIAVDMQAQVFDRIAPR